MLTAVEPLKKKKKSKQFCTIKYLPNYFNDHFHRSPTTDKKEK